MNKKSVMIAVSLIVFFLLISIVYAYGTPHGIYGMVADECGSPLSNVKVTASLMPGAFDDYIITYTNAEGEYFFDAGNFEGGWNPGYSREKLREDFLSCRD